MPKQPRAAATRQRLIDAAVELFVDHGYAETGLNNIAERAETTTGAFYYHFASKEALAAAITQQGWPKALSVIAKCTESRAPALENIITMTFALSELMKSDRSVWIANHLNGALGQLSEDGRRNFRKRASTFVDGVARSVDPSDLRDSVTTREVANMVWITVHGCHLLSDAMGDNVFTRLAQSWKLILPSIVPTESFAYFEQFLVRTAAQFGATDLDELSPKGGTADLRR